MPIDNAPRNKVTKDSVPHFVNEELLPLLRRLRETLNRMLVSRELFADAGALEIDWVQGRHYGHTLADSLTSVTFTDPVDVGEYFLVVAQVGGKTIAGWPSSVRWFGGSAPVITGTGGRVDLLRFYWDGTSYYGTALQDA